MEKSKSQPEQVKDQVTGKQNATNNDGAPVNPGNNPQMKGDMKDKDKKNPRPVMKGDQQSKNSDMQDSMGSGKRQDDN